MVAVVALCGAVVVVVVIVLHVVVVAVIMPRVVSWSRSSPVWCSVMVVVLCRVVHSCGHRHCGCCRGRWLTVVALGGEDSRASIGKDGGQ